MLQAEVPSTSEGQETPSGRPLLDWTLAFQRRLQAGRGVRHDGNGGLQVGSPQNGTGLPQIVNAQPGNGVVQNGNGVPLKRQTSLTRENSFKRQNSWAVTDPRSLGRNTFIYTWGNGDMGQLGLESTETHTTPQLVKALKGRDIVAATGNLWNSAFLTGRSL